jgi:hypothetical protein
MLACEEKASMAPQRCHFDVVVWVCLRVRPERDTKKKALFLAFLRGLQGNTLLAFVSSFISTSPLVSSSTRTTTCHARTHTLPLFFFFLLSVLFLLSDEKSKKKSSFPPFFFPLTVKWEGRVH